MEKPKIVPVTGNISKDSEATQSFVHRGRRFFARIVRSHPGIHRAITRILYAEYEEKFVLFFMKFILAPAAYILPKKCALGLAYALAFLLTVLTKSGIQTYRDMQKAFGLDRLSAMNLAWKWRVQPFRDIISTKRFIKGRENIEKWNIVEKNTDSINEIRSTGESYIIACGHFMREAEASIYLDSIVPGHIYRVANRPPEGGDERNRRLGFQLDTLLQTQNAIHRGGVTYAYVESDSTAAATAFSALRNSNNVVIINIDAPYQDGSAGSFSRPFAGFRNKTFAVGAVALARLVKCPIITCICHKKSDKTAIIEWGNAIRPVGRGGKEQNISLTNQLLDQFEIEIGKRPNQYIMEIGSERRWNPVEEKWTTI